MHNADKYLNMHTYKSYSQRRKACVLVFLQIKFLSHGLKSPIATMTEKPPFLHHSDNMNQQNQDQKLY